MNSPSSTVYEFVLGVIEAVTDEDALLYQAEVLDGEAQKMTKVRGLVVSNSEFALEPDRTFDAVVIIGFWVKIEGKEATERRLARDQCFEMARTIADAFYADSSLGGEVCDSLLLRAIDGSRNVTSTPYAVINLPIILNPSGVPVSYNFGEPK